MLYFLPFIFAFLLSFSLTGLVKKIGLHYGIVSNPRERDVHTKPIPRIGGVAIALSFVLVSLFFFLFLRTDLTFGLGSWFSADKRLFGISIASVFLVLTMLIDDIRGLSAWQKLACQCFAVIIIIASGIGIDHLSNPFGEAINLNSVYVPILTYHGTVYHFSLWSDLLTLIWLVGMMNAINFVDGVDGLAGGVSVIASLIIFLLSISIAINQPATATLAIILAGAAAGFLLWNFPPAKIFMGDSGSMFLGFMLGVLALISGGKLATAFLALGFPIIDGVLVAGGRILRGENPLTTPDKTHLHHRFLEAGFSVRQSIVFLYIITAAFGCLALRFKTIDKMVAAFVLIVLLIVLVKTLNYLSIKKVTK